MKRLQNKCFNVKLIILSITIFSILYLFYIKYYYGSITVDTLIKHTVGSLNILGSYIYYIIDKLFSNENLLQTIVISSVFIYIFINIDIENIVKRALDISYKDFKLSMSAAKDEKVKEDNSIKQMESDKTIDDDKVKYAKIKSKLIQLLIDNDELVELIEKVISTRRYVKIPLNLIPNKYQLKELASIFEYKVFSNAVRIICIKKEIEPALIDAYNELKEKGILYRVN